MLEILTSVQKMLSDIWTELSQTMVLTEKDLTVYFLMIGAILVLFYYKRKEKQSHEQQSE